MTKEAGDLYAKVMVDTPGLGLLDYAVPADMLVAVGDRVVVGLRTRNVVGIERNSFNILSENFISGKVNGKFRFSTLYPNNSRFS